MQNKTIALTKANVTYLVKFLILLAIATGAPLLGFHSQWITGPIVNTALILSVFLIGIRGGLLIGILPSTIALGTGLLPAVLAPMIPFIIISNCILILAIDFFCHSERARALSDGEVKNPLNMKKVIKPTLRDPSLTLRMTNKNYWLGLFFASGLKYLFLFLTSGIVINLLLNSKVASAVAQVMSWPQFFTAMLGGILAFAVLKIIKK